MLWLLDLVAWPRTEPGRPPGPATKASPKRLVGVLPVALMTLSLACARDRIATTDIDLHPDARHEQAVEFELLGVSVPLAPDRYVRYAGVVDDLDATQEALLREAGLDPERVAYTNAATNGRTLAVRFRNGTHVAFVWVRRQENPHFTRASLEHERYHALSLLDEASLEVVHDHVAGLGFEVAWADLDEEMRATVVQVVGLHAQGMSLDALTGSELVIAARELLIAGATQRTQPTVQRPAGH